MKTARRQNGYSHRGGSQPAVAGLLVLTAFSAFDVAAYRIDDRFASSDGEFGVGISTVKPYNQIHFFLQLTPWLESAVRYTSVTNRGYSATGRERYKDRSVDFKLRLVEEGQYHPAFAIGVQDVGGTGLFSSEYVVSSYHYYDLDFTLGLAWGRLGARGDIRNPLAVFGGDYDKPRALTSSEGAGLAGSGGLSRLFSGDRIGPFGGIEWRALRNLSLKVEYDGNNYQQEGLLNRFDVSFPINAGINYQPFKGVELQLAYERGNTLSAGATLALNFQQFKGVPKLADPVPTPLPKTDRAPVAESVSASGSTAVPRSTQTVTDQAILADSWVLRLREELRGQQIQLAGLSYRPQSGALLIWFQQDKYNVPARAAGRVLRACAALAPEPVESITAISQTAGVETYRLTVRRDDFERVVRHEEPFDSLGIHASIAGPESDSALAGADLIDTTRLPAFDWTMGPSLRQNIGGPDGFILAQLLWRINGELAVTDRLSVAGGVGLNIYNNFDESKQTSNSVLPHVRSDITQYLKHGENGISRLEADYIGSPLASVYARISAGIFEEMYGGVAAELLWRPFGRPWAIGLDMNHVFQRDYDQLVSFRDYNVTTGFIDVYYQLPLYDILAKLSVGRYLAGDKGATLDLSRTFDSGIQAGIFATKTDVSAERFGEGSFDKGIYISIPLDLFAARSSRSRGQAIFRPLTRDGGQRAIDGKSLYPLTADSNPSLIAKEWRDISR